MDVEMKLHNRPPKLKMSYEIRLNFEVQQKLVSKISPSSYIILPHIFLHFKSSQIKLILSSDFFCQGIIFIKLHNLGYK